MPPKLKSIFPGLDSIKYITISNGRVVYRPYIKSSNRNFIETDKYGFLKPPVRLGHLTDPEDVILAAYLAAKSELDNSSGVKKHTLRWVVDEYRKSRIFKSLAIGSQKRTEALLKILDHPISLNGQNADFGSMPIRKITKPIVRRLADKRLKDYQGKGRKGTVMVNREITFLSTAINWATQHIDNLGVKENPFRISKFKEEANKRYVTDEEYELQKKIAAEVRPFLPWVFEITYLIASRGIETLDIMLADINEDRNTGGIDVERRKGSKSNTIEWSDRLYHAYKELKRFHTDHKISDINAPLVLNMQGGKLSKSGLDSAMQDLRQLMKKRGLIDKYWSLHLLKSKGQSDAENERIAGLKSERMRERYNTKRETIKPVK